MTHILRPWPVTNKAQIDPALMLLRGWVVMDSAENWPYRKDEAIRDVRLVQQLCPCASHHVSHARIVDQRNENDAHSPLASGTMRFPRDPDPSRMLKDMPTLMKVSQIG